VDWVRRSLISPPLPQGTRNLHGDSRIPIGFDGGSAPGGRFWSIAHEFGDSQGGDSAARCVVATKVATLLGVWQHHLLQHRGEGPSLRDDTGSLHGRGGGVRCGPVKRRPPCVVTKMARDNSDLHGKGRVGTEFFFGGKVSSSTPLAMAGGSHGVPRW
jgi:hypothetical protein